MPPQTLAARVESIEGRVTGLEKLPARMDRLELQIVQLRREMHDEFSAIRSEMHDGDEQVVRTLREEIRTGDEETRRVLREEMRAVADEIMGQARMLYEDLRDRIVLMQEGQPPPRRRKPS